VRVVRNVATGTQKLTTLTGTQCVPLGGQERIITAFIKPEQIKPGMLSKRSKEDRDTLTLAKQAWRDAMRIVMPDFKVKQYKYITLGTVEG